MWRRIRIKNRFELEPDGFLCRPVKGVSVFEEPHVILGYIVDEMSGRVDLTQGQFVMVSVIEDVHQIGVERMNLQRRVYSFQTIVNTENPDL